MYSVFITQTYPRFNYGLELIARDCLLSFESKVVDLQATVSRLHSLVLITTNQNKKIASPLTGDTFSTQNSHFEL